MELPAVVAARVGHTMGSWWGFGEPGEAHGDQSPDDDCSITFTSRPLVGAALVIAGTPSVTLRVAVDTETAFLAVRLCVVDGNTGRSTLLSYGVQNLVSADSKQSNGHDSAACCGDNSCSFFDVSLRLRPLAVRLSAGQSLRLAISQQLWPLIWPSAKVPNLKVKPGWSLVYLPVLTTPSAVASSPSGPSNPLPVPLATAVFACDTVEIYKPRRTQMLLQPSSSREVTWRTSDGVQLHTVVDDSGIVKLFECSGRHDGDSDCALVFGACETTKYGLVIQSPDTVLNGDQEDEPQAFLAPTPSVTCEHLLVVSSTFVPATTVVGASQQQDESNGNSDPSNGNRLVGSDPISLVNGNSDPIFAWISTSTTMTSSAEVFHVTFRTVVHRSPTLPASWAEVRRALSTINRSTKEHEGKEGFFFFRSGEFSCPRLLL
jgi:hypothetical protein